MKLTVVVLSLLSAVNGLNAVPQIVEEPQSLEGPNEFIPVVQCDCRNDYDCFRSKYCPNTCVFDKWYSLSGTCKNPVPPPTKPPTEPPTKSPTAAPTPNPTRPPTRPTTTGCPCESDYDCQRSPYCPNKCVFRPYSSVGQCQDQQEPTKEPTGNGGPHDQCCDNPRNIPTECEVRLLIEILENAIGVNFAIIPQLLRLSFHDAGTFNQNIPEGGANGCLLTHPPMRTMGENHNLEIALNTLAVVKNNWEAHPDTCIEISAADMIQFGGMYSVIRQKDIPGLTATKINELVTLSNFWGRPDELNCQTAWTSNLPGFQLGSNPSNIPARCKFAGGEIKEKMMNRNGFSDIEATALMGAHTIGLTRNVFGTGSLLVSKWSHNGGDHDTPQGPVFDNGFHQYLEFDVVENDVFSFAGNTLAFDVIFGDWFRETATQIGHLDTDMALAFPSIDTSIHPHFDIFTEQFANDNAVFMHHFMIAMRKMSTLGVTVPLFDALDCAEGCEGVTSSPVLTKEIQVKVVQEIEEAVIEAEEQILRTEMDRAGEIAELTTPVELDIMK